MDDGRNILSGDKAKTLMEIIEQEEETGRWIPVTNGRGGHECNRCHNYAPSYRTGREHLSDYCPHCGKQMDATDTNNGKGGKQE